MIERPKRRMITGRRAAAGVGAAAAVAAGAAAAFFGPDILREMKAHPVAAQPVRSAAPALPQAQASWVPSRVRITAIGVDARVESVGITSSGTMGVPQDIKDVGWYALGVHPGQAGDAVIDGHLTWTSGPGVFAKLGQLKPGDTVIVDYTDGTTRQFKVAKTTEYPWNDRPAGLFATGGSARLSLVTCSGTWNGKAYSNRVVVEATLA